MKKFLKEKILGISAVLLMLMVAFVFMPDTSFAAVTAQQGFGNGFWDSNGRHEELTEDDHPDYDKLGHGTIYVYLSNDGEYVDSPITGEKMAGIPIDLDDVAAEINLEDYGYEMYNHYLPDDEDGEPITSLFHVYLYLLNHYYEDGSAGGMNVTGGADSLYMQNGFWGHDENLTYYVNGAYPLYYEGWGATCDGIFPEDGDFIDLQMYTDWGFYSDPKAGYHYFLDENENITHMYSANPGEKVDIRLGRAWGDLNIGGATEITPEDYYSFCYGSEPFSDECEYAEIEDGKAELTFKEPGTYYVWAKGDISDDLGSPVNSPAFAKVQVKCEEHDFTQKSNDKEHYNICSICGFISDKEAHTFGEPEIINEATCAEKGSAKYVCEECRAEVEKAIPKLEHTPDEGTVTPATCHKSGKTVIACTECGTTINVVSIPKTSTHTMHAATAATCTKPGNKLYYECDECGTLGTNQFFTNLYTQEQVVIPATGHGTSIFNVGAKEATCTEPGGSAYYLCNDCGQLYKDAELTEFVYDFSEDSIPKQQPYYSNNRWNYYQWAITQEIEPKGDIQAKGHSYVDQIVEPTCTEAGYTLHICSICQDNYTDTATEPKGHSWGEWEEINSPSCETAGSKQHTCTVCQATETADIDPAGHAFSDNFTVDKKATFTEDGSMSKHCTREGCSAAIESTAIPSAALPVCEAGQLVYNGEEQKPAVKVLNREGQSLAEGTDYKVAYTDNVNAGTGHAVVTLKGEAYEGQETVDFTIVKAGTMVPSSSNIRVRINKTASAKLDVPGSVTYKVANTKIATVSADGTVKGIKPGKTLLKITCAGDDNHASYNATVSVFVPKEITKAKLSKTKFTYNGKAQKPKIKTVNKSKKLKNGVAYKVVWAENPVVAGTYTVVIKGIGAYDGSVTKTYTIKKAKQKVKVAKASTTVGNTVQLKASAKSKAGFTYKSLNGKATVDANGVVTGKKAGTARIKVTAVSDKCYEKASKTIRVKIKK